MAMTMLVKIISLHKLAALLHKDRTLTVLPTSPQFQRPKLGKPPGQLADSYEGMRNTFVQWHRVPTYGLLMSME
jgi:hypothetical protein